MGGRLTGVRDEYQAILEGQEKNSGNSGIELVSGSDLQAVIADCDRMPRSGVLETAAVPSRVPCSSCVRVRSNQ